MKSQLDQLESVHLIIGFLLHESLGVDSVDDVDEGVRDAQIRRIVVGTGINEAEVGEIFQRSMVKYSSQIFQSHGK